MSLSYNSMEGQTLLTEWPLGVGLMLSFCRKEVLVWSSLFDGDSPMPLKGRTNPLIFVDLLNIQKVVLNITALHTLNKYLNKRKRMMKREILNVHVYVSLLPSEVLCRNFCWELVDGLSLWFLLLYNIFSTTQLKNTHHLVCRRMYLWIYWQPLYSPKWLQQRTLEALRLQPLGRTSAVF